jgi:hydrogenase maturation protease
MKTAIYGIGNILLGDDGIGPAVVNHLTSNFTFPADVTIEDLGTPSLDLPNYLTGYDLVIFIDAVAVDAPPGTIRLFSREEIIATPPGIRISPHEPTINDALIVLDFAGGAPKDVVLVGIVPETLENGMTLSPAVAEAVPLAASAVLGQFAERTSMTTDREQADYPGVELKTQLVAMTA